MNHRHRETLRKVFEAPAPADLRWSDIESMLSAAGAEIIEGAGSRVRMKLNGVRSVFHRPHPNPQASRASVRGVRDFCKAAGLAPGKE